MQVNASAQNARCRMLHLHPDLTPHEAIATWSWDVYALPSLLTSAALYARGAYLMHQRGGGASVRPWQAASFTAGWSIAALALVSPIDTISDILLSVHMTQHMLLMLLAAPLIVLGRPLAVMLWAFPARTRKAIVSLTKRPVVRHTWHWLTLPVTVFLAHAAALWIWHVPALYETAVREPGIHFIEHVCFTGTAALFWWTLIHGRYGRAGYGIAVAYVFATTLHSTLLGAFMTLSERMWYPSYDSPTRAWHLNPTEDQQLAGLLMWIPAGILLTLFGLALFAAWLGEAERRVQAFTNSRGGL